LQIYTLQAPKAEPPRQKPKVRGLRELLREVLQEVLRELLRELRNDGFFNIFDLFWSGNREDFALYWHTSCPQMHLAANLSNNIQHIFPFPPQKETI
jgi:hypothetical protein